MANVLVQESSLQGIAAAIREKNGTATTYKPAQMAEAISALETGGGFYPSLLIKAPTGHTLTATNGTDIVTLTEIAEGQYWGEVTDYGEWTVTDTTAGSTVTVQDVTMVEQYEYSPFATYTWDEIAAIGAEGNGANYWSIGDTHPVTLNGTVGITTYTNASYHVFIAHFNYKEQNGIYLMGFMDPTTNKVLGLCDANYNSYKVNGTKIYSMNHWGSTYSTPFCRNFGGWKGCDLRYDILGSTNVAPSGYGSIPTTSRAGNDPSNYDIVNSPVSNTLIAALPSALRQNMKPFTVYTDNVGNSSTAAANVTSSVDYIVLPAEYEIYGTTVMFANENEPAQQEQLEFYRLGNSKITYKDTDPATEAVRWGRSPNRTYTSDFIVVSPNIEYSQVRGPEYSCALTPLLRVA